MDVVGINLGGSEFLPSGAQGDYANAQSIAIGASATQTFPFSSLATVVTLKATVACWFSVGGTAGLHVAGSDFLPANVTWMLKIPPGAVLSFIQNTVGGWVAVTPMASSESLPLLLDSVPSAVAAYSLRRLTNAYTGPAVNIRRSTDNATQDIAFLGNDFNVAAFSAFIGGGSGFVAIWYDQSGNSRNATAIGGSTGAQSPIALAVTPSGKAAINATATTQGMVAACPANPAVCSLAMVTNRTGNQTAYAVPLSYDGGSPGIAYNNAANTGVVFGNVGVVITPAAVITDNAFHSSVGIMNGAATQVTTETGATATNSITGATGSTQIDLIGRGGFGYQGYMAEGIIWNRALSGADTANIFASQRGYYGF